jgi:hypothetical protein
MKRVVSTKFGSGLTLGQIKHVLRASRGKGAPQKSGYKAIYCIATFSISFKPLNSEIT